MLIVGIIALIISLNLSAAGCTSNTAEPSPIPTLTPIATIKTQTPTQTPMQKPTLLPTIFPTETPTYTPVNQNSQKKTLYLDWTHTCWIHGTMIPGQANGGTFDFRVGKDTGTDSIVHIYVTDYPKVCVPVTVTVDGVAQPVTQVCHWEPSYECLARSDSISARNLAAGTHWVVVSFAGNAEYNPATLTGSFEVIR
jgi:hypothetical protein